MNQPVRLSDKVSIGHRYTWKQYVNNKCKLLKDIDGVRHYIDTNGHYIVWGELVYIGYGFEGNTLFNQLVQAAIASKARRVSADASIAIA